MRIPIISALGRITDDLASIIEQSARIGNEALIDEGIKRDLSSAKDIMTMRAELNISDTDLGAVNALRALRMGIAIPVAVPTEDKKSTE